MSVKKTAGKARRRIMSGVLMAAMAFCLLAVPAAAQTRQELEAQVQASNKEAKEATSELKSIQSTKRNAQWLKVQLEEEQEQIIGQISVLLEEIDVAKNDIELKQQEMDAQQAEIDERWNGFKARLVTLQKLRDGGAVAMLGECDTLYEILTFSDTLQQVTEKETTLLQELKTELERLSEQKQELESRKAQLEEQKTQLEAKQKELADNIQKQDATIKRAEAEEKAQKKVVAEANRRLTQATTALQAYIRKMNSQSLPNIACSLDFICPLAQFKYTTTQFGEGGHRGIDLAAAGWTPIRAVADGYVNIAEYNNSYGYYVQVYHGTDTQGRSFASLYAHMVQWPSVSVGQYVQKGQVIGYVGNTGYSFGNHLHLELRVNNSLVNPRSYIPIG